MKLVEVTDLNGETLWHIAAELPGNYHTVCGLSTDDGDNVPKREAEVTKSRKCNCTMCYEVWRAITNLRIRNNDFDLTNLK